jgi:hypothetical protein
MNSKAGHFSQNVSSREDQSPIFPDFSRSTWSLEPSLYAISARLCQKKHFFGDRRASREATTCTSRGRESVGGDGNSWWGAGSVRDGAGRRDFGVSVNACRRFATRVPSGSYAHHGFAPMASACRRFATRNAVAGGSLGKRDSKPAPVNRRHLPRLCVHSLARDLLAQHSPAPDESLGYCGLSCTCFGE